MWVCRRKIDEYRGLQCSLWCPYGQLSVCESFRVGAALRNARTQLVPRPQLQWRECLRLQELPSNRESESSNPGRVHQPAESSQLRWHRHQPQRRNVREGSVSCGRWNKRDRAAVECEGTPYSARLAGVLLVGCRS